MAHPTAFTVRLFATDGDPDILQPRFPAQGDLGCRRAPARTRPMSDTGEIILFQTEDGQTRIDVRLVSETVWLLRRADRGPVPARQVGRPFLAHQERFLRGRTRPSWQPWQALLTVQLLKASAEITRDIEHYSLDVIISVGYRVKSQRGVQFRIWATRQLRDYLVKGFVLNDEKFKQGKGNPYSTSCWRGSATSVPRRRSFGARCWRSTP